MSLVTPRRCVADDERKLCGDKDVFKTPIVLDGSIEERRQHTGQGVHLDAPAKGHWPMTRGTLAFVVPALVEAHHCGHVRRCDGNHRRDQAFQFTNTHVVAGGHHRQDGRVTTWGSKRSTNNADAQPGAAGRRQAATKPTIANIR